MNPTVTIAMQAWNRFPERFDYFRRACQGLLTHLRGWEHVARWCVVVTRERHLLAREFEEFCEANGVEILYYFGEPNLGASQNYLLAHAETPLVLYLQDDFVLREPLDLAPDVGLLQSGEAEMVRYVWHLEPGEKTCGTREFQGAEYSVFDPRQMLWFYSDNPYLARCSLFERVGPFSTKIVPGLAHSEIDFLWRCKAAEAKIVGRGAAPTRWFDHVGTCSSLVEKWDVHRQNAERARQQRELDCAQGYDFSVDWTGPFRENLLEHLGTIAGQPLRYLEIGVHEGRSGCWMLDEILTHPESRYVGIDPWNGAGPESVSEARARHNLARFGAKVELLKGESGNVLPTLLELPRPARESFDLVYIDGGHWLAAALVDSVFAWSLVRPGGVIIWDDYTLGDPAPVALAVDRFLDCLGDQFELLFRNSQVGIRKLARPAS